MLRSDIIRMAFTVLFCSKTIQILCAFGLLFSRHSLLAALLASSTKQEGINCSSNALIPTCNKGN